LKKFRYYAGTIIYSAGIRDPHTVIWIAAGVSSVNFVATFVPMYLVERLGRRLLLFISMAGVILALFTMGAAFLLINRDSAITIDPEITTVNVSVAQYFECKALSNCDHCVTDEKCGFCQPDQSVSQGYCLPYAHENPEKSLTGPCEYSNGTMENWEHSFCPSKYSWIPIAVMIFYLAFFSIGYAPLPWVLNAEFYPLWARSTCCALSTCSNWTFNLVISLTFLSLTQAATKYGRRICHTFFGICAFWNSANNSATSLQLPYSDAGIKFVQYCLPYAHENPERSLTGPCEYSNGTMENWEHSFCPSKYSWIPIAVMIFYLAFFSIGYAPLPWVLNAEFYPLWARSTCCALSTCSNWTFNLVISLTFLSLTQAATKYGAFFIYGGITCFAFVFFYFCVPETKGYNIEEIEVLFMSRNSRKRTHTTLAKKQIAEEKQNHITTQSSINFPAERMSKS
ncbi:unnamed protein product, partial [Gongylonema pulchrum]|uniref:MFS domain-containing protein n=1 Tax=Gongylonema pulchrum TaxID=637853 RepID=A0A183DYM5_9BILA